MLELDKISQGLHPLERKLLPFIPKYGSVSDLIHYSGLKEVEVTRALQWLKNKQIISVKEDVQQQVYLDTNGKLYLKQGLPERNFLNSLNREMSIRDIGKASRLSKEEVSVSLGILKKKNAINISKKGSDVFVSLTDIGRNILKKDMLEETFLKKQFPLNPKSLASEELYAYGELIKRREILKTESEKTRRVSLTDIGIALVGNAETLGKEFIDSLTPEMIKNRSWQGKEFRTYDLSFPVPKTSYGKRHFENEAIDYIKSMWLNLGFTEMSGGMVQSAFWDLDVLFVPQDHPAREMQDTFYIKKPSHAIIPNELAKKVKTVHENGGDSGSIGWRYEWSEEKAKEILLRTHTTALSAQTLSKLKKEDLPQKFFSVGKVFRNEAVDWNHLFEFYQVEGIVIDPDATLNDLKGYLTEFFTKMGYTKVMIRPSHFPYTEPSAEVSVYSPERGQWIELGGAGIFRPEVTKTLLGFECPVLAWGLGLGRVVVSYYNIKDLRDFNRNDLKQLRSMKKWLLQPR